MGRDYNWTKVYVHQFGVHLSESFLITWQANGNTLAAHFLQTV